MEQAAIVSYAVGYVAAIILAFLILLPVLVPILLLLLVGGVVQLLVLAVRALALGIYRYGARLIRGVVQAVRNSRDGPRGGHGGHRLHTP